MSRRLIPVGIMHNTIAVLFIAIVAGCASYSGHGLVPGQSTIKDVEALMGPPTDKIEQADHGATWFYSRQPMGRQTFAMRVGADGILRSIEPVLNYNNLAKVIVGQTTREQLRAILGPPNRIDRMPRQQQDSWEYWMVLDSVPVHVWVQLSDDGIVHDIAKGEDLSRVRGGRR